MWTAQSQSWSTPHSQFPEWGPEHCPKPFLCPHRLPGSWFSQAEDCIAHLSNYIFTSTCTPVKPRICVSDYCIPCTENVYALQLLTCPRHSSMVALELVEIYNLFSTPSSFLIRKNSSPRISKGRLYSSKHLSGKPLLPSSLFDIILFPVVIPKTGKNVVVCANKILARRQYPYQMLHFISFQQRHI